MSGCFALIGCGDFRDELPEKIEISDEIVSSYSSIFMSGCARAVYRFSEQTAATVLQQRSAYFSDVAPPPNQNPDNPYSDWRETPLTEPPIGRVFALSAVGGCEANEKPFDTRIIERALRERGSFYALTQNNEGMILVAPRARIAAFFYFG